MTGKILVIENGVAKTPIPLPKEIFHCAMYDDGTSCYESSGISEQEIEDAISAGKLVVCSFVTMHSGDILTTELIASSVLGPYPIFTGTSKTSSGLLVFKVTYDAENSTAQQEWWSVERTYISSSELPALSGNAGKILSVNANATGLTWMSIDTELSETSTNPVQNKAINVLTRKLWDKVDIVSRLGNEYPDRNLYISSGEWVGTASSSRKHWIVPVDGIRQVTITSNANVVQAYSFLKTYTTPVSGNTPDYATGYSSIKSVAVSKTAIIPVPKDAKYLYLNTGSNGAAKAVHVYLTGVAINEPDSYIAIAPQEGQSTYRLALTDTKQSFFIDNRNNNYNVVITIDTSVFDIVFQDYVLLSGSYAYIIDSTIVFNGSNVCCFLTTRHMHLP